MVKITDEELSYRLVKLYFDEIARLGVKRSLDLDAVMQAYYYTLDKLKNKEIEIIRIMEKEKLI